jgi:Predicted helicase
MKATICYHDIGDYQTREQKLERVKGFGSVANMKDTFRVIQPNKHNDWIDHRDEGFEELIQLAPTEKFNVNTQSFFTIHSSGTVTSRDAWVYSSSKDTLVANIQRTLDFYEIWRKKLTELTNEKRALPSESLDASKISWSRALRKDVEKGHSYSFDAASIHVAIYRPFFKQNFYFNRALNEMPCLMSRLFPTTKHENLLICMSGLGMPKDFSVLITEVLPDFQLMPNGQCFPLYYYEKNEHTQQLNLFGKTQEHIRRDGISDFILKRAIEQYGSKVTKEDIFYYVYGILHNEEYRKKYAVNLRKSLPRLPLLEPKLFRAFSKAGRELADLHLNYETQPPCGVAEEHSRKATPSYRVTKMRFAKHQEQNEEDKAVIVYNDDISVIKIPLEAYEYIVNGKSAIEWVMERYQVTTHKESGIINDPNLWCDEHSDPRYIIDLLKRVIALSLETMKIVKSLPKLEL